MLSLNLILKQCILQDIIVHIDYLNRGYLTIFFNVWIIFIVRYLCCNVSIKTIKYLCYEILFFIVIEVLYENIYTQTNAWLPLSMLCHSTSSVQLISCADV
jgi:hypothetical protein